MLPELIATKEPVFAIPFRIERLDNPRRQPAEVQLLVSSDRGSRWQMYAKAPPAQQQFLFRRQRRRRVLVCHPHGRPLGPSPATANRRPGAPCACRYEATGAEPIGPTHSCGFRIRALGDRQADQTQEPQRRISRSDGQFLEPGGSGAEGRRRSYRPQERPGHLPAEVDRGRHRSRAEVSDTAGNAAIAQVQVETPRDVARSSADAAEPRGSVAISINPPIGNRFPALQKATGDSKTLSLPPGEHPRMVNSRLFELEYEIDSIGPSGIGSVELWGTRDSGRTWRSYAVDQDKRSPILVTVDEEGVYGFRIVVTNGAGLGGKPPQAGDLPDLWVGVDVTRPVARIISAEQGTDAEAGCLIIAWQADDRMLAARPVSLSFSQKRTGPWLPIAAGLDNTGRYAWPLENRMPAQFYLRLAVRDEAGNIGAYETSDPVTIDQSRPTVRVRDVRPVGPTAAQPARHW